MSVHTDIDSHNKHITISIEGAFASTLSTIFVQVMPNGMITDSL